MKYARLPAELQAERLTVEVLPKKLDEEVALEMVRGFGGDITKFVHPVVADALTERFRKK